mmetsp:Transcript_19281/g.47294  ORF Transcript_19281/g.47294 Transcript_19281/m.47294 type:complete len:138 (-) Transcript_19281:2066-2479(-)
MSAQLTAMKCEPCASRGGTPVRMTQEEIEKHMAMICPSWKLSPEGEKITRVFNAKNFVAAMEFLNKLADLAESEGHHPDFSISSWNCVTVTLWTHSLKGLDKNDFIVAAKADLIPVDYSPKWLKEHPEVTAGVPKSA